MSVARPSTRSVLRTAYPSTIDLSCGGLSTSLAIDSANTRPSASPRPASTGDNVAACSKTWWSASATESIVTTQILVRSSPLAGAATPSGSQPTDSNSFVRSADGSPRNFVLCAQRFSDPKVEFCRFAPRPSRDFLAIPCDSSGKIRANFAGFQNHCGGNVVIGLLSWLDQLILAAANNAHPPSYPTAGVILESKPPGANLATM